MTPTHHHLRCFSSCGIVVLFSNDGSLQRVSHRDFTVGWELNTCNRSTAVSREDYHSQANQVNTGALSIVLSTLCCICVDYTGGIPLPIIRRENERGS